MGNFSPVMFSGPFMMKCILYTGVSVNCALTRTHSKEEHVFNLFSHGSLWSVAVPVGS